MSIMNGVRESCQRREWVVVKVPYGGGHCSLNLVKSEGAKHAPDALEKEFKRQIIFLADNGALVDRLKWYKADISLLCQNNYSAWNIMHNKLFAMAKIFLSGKNVLFLGGSHTISYSTVDALSATVGRNSVGLVVLDAHPDCCKKADWPIHSDWLRELVQNGRVLPENVVLIGLKQVEQEEYKFLKKWGIKYYQMSRIGDPRHCVTDNFQLSFDLEKIAKLKASYFSIDIDVVSAAFAPGTGCPSPGGLTDIELISMIKQIKLALPNLRAADLVEIDPLNWWRKKILRHDTTVDLGVKLIKEIVS